MNTIHYANRIKLFLLFILCFFSSIEENYSQVSLSQRQALIDLYNATDGSNWTNSNNWLSQNPVNDWHGVTVTDDKVTQINLERNNLTGNIPNTIRDLSSLVKLSFEYNKLSGSIPVALANLVSLTNLSLRWNKLTGPIPAEIGNLKSLTSLSLGGNKLTGSIPLEIGDLTSLTSLILSGTDLSGSIPLELSNLIYLENLELGSSELTGSIPLEIFDLTSLITLSLSSNQLTGIIPSEIGNLTALEKLSLAGNQLTGVIPLEIGNLTSLGTLALGDNQLTGVIPLEIGNLTLLKSLLLANNKLTGQLPEVLGTLSKLQYLYIYKNQLSGKIPENFAAFTEFKSFQLQENRFVFSDLDPTFSAIKATIEANSNSPIHKFEYAPQNKVDQIESLSVSGGQSITLSSNDLISSNNSYQWYKDGVAIAGETNKDLVLSNASETDAGLYYFKVTNSIVTDLTLERNPITLSVIPAEDTCGVSESEKQALWDLYLSTNGDNWKNTLANNQPWNLNIPVCDWYGVSVVSGKIIKVILDNNNLVGNLPITLTDLEYIEDFLLYNNKLSGRIPAELGLLSNLKRLNLSSNQLIEEIPLALGNLSNLNLLDLGNNKLSGTIPSELGVLVNLRTLTLAQNQLSGAIPSELGLLSNLRTLSLTINLLSGEIPLELGNLSSLRTLNLASNQLSGAIPSSIGGLRFLQQLLLGSNKLEGQIPTEIGDLSNLKVLWLNQNKLKGIPSSIGNLQVLEQLLLSDNDLEGGIPISIVNLSNLKVVWLSNNNLNEKVPSFLNSIDSFQQLKMNGNDFVFSDFESEHMAYSEIRTYNYAPQAKVDQTETVSVQTGQSITLSSSALTSPNNSYQWYKDGVAIVGAINKDYILTSALDTDAGVYYFKATNSIVTDLTLERNPITLTIDEVVDTCGVSEIEKQALIDLYNSANGARWTNNTNWLTDVPVCDWYGVTVVDRKITRLDLSSNNLSGTISSSIIDLTSLVSLRLARNKLSGEIPTNIQALKVLEELYLNYNELTGTIPRSLIAITTLEVLYLGNNKLTGSIPENIGNLVNLKAIKLLSNQIEGQIPVSIGTISELIYLRLENNKLTGLIPASIASLTKLQHLGVNDNLLSGTIPSDFVNMPNLSYLNISNNNFQGTIPDFTDTPRFSIFSFKENNFIFSDFESEFEAYENKFQSNFVYAPQAKVDREETIQVRLGESVNLVTEQLSSINNTYTWYKDNDELIQTTERGIVIDNITANDLGEYYFIATNNVVDGLTLERHKITLVLNTETNLEQQFCTAMGATYVKDLRSPFLDSDANWSFTETELLILSPNYEITETILLWAQSINNPLDPRIAIQVVIDRGMPTGPAIQVFEATINPVVNNLVANGSVIQWYSSAISTTPLDGNTTLIDNTYYYAEQKSQGCRLKVLVKINLTANNCNVLIGIADGSFENCYETAGIIGTNIQSNDLTCSNFDTPRNLMYTWKIGTDNQRNPSEISSLIQPSPDGDVFASCRVYQPQSQFPTGFSSVLQKQLDTLEIGSEYEISFYQSNGGYYGITSEFNASWKVSWGTDRIEVVRSTPTRNEQVSIGGIDIGTIPSGPYQISPPMIVKAGFSLNTLDTPTWELVKIKFTATASSQTIKFTPVVPTLNNVDNGVLMHLLIDGIKVAKVDGDCDNNSEVTNFCLGNNSEEYPIIFNLIPHGDTINWYLTETGGTPLSENTAISVEADNPEGVTYWWDDTTDGISVRTPLVVTVSTNIPVIEEFQSFPVGMQATIADLQAEDNVTWYIHPFQGDPLPIDTLLEDKQSYFAEAVGASCRATVTVLLETISPSGDGYQTFCEGATLADVVLEIMDGSTIVWYNQETSGGILPISTILVHGTTYYAAHLDTYGVESEDRKEVSVNIISVSPPYVPSTLQRFYANQSHTIGDLLAIGYNLRWFDKETGGVAYSNSEELIDGEIYYADQESKNGCSGPRQGVLVRIVDEDAPILFGCEKFKPSIGDRYVINAWVREQGVDPVNPVIRSFNGSEESELFVGLLNHLKDKVINTDPELYHIPDIYIPESNTENLDFDALMPYVKNIEIDERKIIVYGFRVEKNNYGHVIGFSFSLNRNRTANFKYLSPKVRKSGAILNYRYPLRDNAEDLTLIFRDVRVVGGKLIIGSDFKMENAGLYNTTLSGMSDNDSGLSGIQDEVTFYEYQEKEDYQPISFVNTLVQINYSNEEGVVIESESLNFEPQGPVIDGWQKVSGMFIIPINAFKMKLSLMNTASDVNAYFDDIRFQPYSSSMKTFVYDPVSQRLKAELDENNYATYYEYDQEGGLIRVKKETERGIYTIQETRSGNSKLNNSGR